MEDLNSQSRSSGDSPDSASSEEVRASLRKAPVKAAEKGLWIDGVAQGQDHQAQTRRPSFDLLLQICERRVADRELRRRRQKLGGLAPGEPQILQTHFGDLVAGQQAHEGQRRIAARHQHQADRAWGMLEQPAHQIVHR